MLLSKTPGGRSDLICELSQDLCTLVHDFQSPPFTPIVNIYSSIFLHINVLFLPQNLSVLDLNTQFTMQNLYIDSILEII